MSQSPRLSILVGLAAAIMAAGPPPTLSLSPSQGAPIPIPVGEPKVQPIIAKVGSGYTAAPVPNSDFTIPFVKDPRQSQAQLAPGLFAPPATGYRGEGYVPGSSAEGEQQRKLKPAPGINLKVPLN
jgi:hypothetical protein